MLYTHALHVYKVNNVKHLEFNLFMFQINAEILYADVTIPPTSLTALSLFLLAAEKEILNSHDDLLWNKHPTITYFL